MILFLTGASHTGKTLLSQKLMERYHIPYFSIDHLKMGLIRSGQTDLTPMDDDLLTPYLWPIVREMVKTAIENGQSMIVEGCYIPFDWAKDFTPEYLSQIRYRCLIMSEAYIRTNFHRIQGFANAIEHRLDDSGLCPDDLVRDNNKNLELCKKHGCEYLLIDRTYSLSPEDVL